MMLSLREMTVSWRNWAMKETQSDLPGVSAVCSSPGWHELIPEEQ